MHNVLGGFLLSVALVGCGTSDTVSLVGSGTETAAVSPTPALRVSGTAEASPAPEVGDAERASLLAQADRLADEHQGRAVQVEAVRTKSSTARSLTGWSTQQPDEDVWVLAISGDDYFCRYCSGPSDDGKRSKHLTLTVRASRPMDERLTDGMSLSPYDLSPFGTVQVLRG